MTPHDRSRNARGINADTHLTDAQIAKTIGIVTGIGIEAVLSTPDVIRLPTEAGVETGIIAETDTLVTMPTIVPNVHVPKRAAANRGSKRT